MFLVGSAAIAAAIGDPCRIEMGEFVSSFDCARLRQRVLSRTSLFFVLEVKHIEGA